MDAGQPGPGQAERLVLAQRIYGAIRNYEMWLIEQRRAPSTEVQQVVRRTFTEANRILREGDLSGARAKYVLALAMIDRLKRPAIET